MPRKASGKRRTPEPLIPLVSDGLHFVRDASPKDQHPMRFVVDQHKQVEHLQRFSTLPRHCENLEVGTELMHRYTKRACQLSSELHRAFKSAKGPVRLELEPKEQLTPKTRPVKKPSKQRTNASPKPKKVDFPLTRFTCVMANPVAQVWLCTLPRGHSQVGRRSESGRPPRADVLPHEVGEYAVLRGDVPILASNGEVRVFSLPMDAEAVMQQLFDEAPDDEHISNNMNPDRRTTTVYQNRSYSVHFDPDYNGTKLPFNIFDTTNFKIVLHPRGNFPLKYRCITNAIEEADRLDKILRGV